MKKSSGLKNIGGDTGKLIVYSDPDFQGEEHTFLGLYFVYKAKLYILSAINTQMNLVLLLFWTN